MKTDKKIEQLLKDTNLDNFSALPDDFVFDPLAVNTMNLKQEESNHEDNNFIKDLNEDFLHIPDKLTFTQTLDFAFPEEIIEGISQVGEVIYIGDGVCKVVGLPKAKIEDIIIVKTQEGPVKALILGIDDSHIESVVMGDYTQIKQGDQVVLQNSKMTIPSGKNILGRVVNPLGEPIDGKGTIKAEEHRLVEFPAPPVLDRAPILDPIQTGIMVIDTTIPIGKGQRELVIGDRKTGKTRLAMDIIANQKGKNVICVYVGIGTQAAKAKATMQFLAERGAMEYTTMVITTSNDPPSLQYIAPYAGVAIAEHFMYKGKDVLIIYDDLSKQAKAYRQVSLLLKRSPGRDAYPGDIFFLHSRLLERASKVNEKLGGGSITALPIAETQSGDVSDYIITNLMSITDGHIYLDANMMHEGILPAVNSGTSVSRIGSKVQVSLMKKVGELASRALARYNEVKSFETINTEVSEDTLRDINRGKRVMEIFSQDSKHNLSEDEQIVILHLATSGKLDDMELAEFPNFKKNFLEFYRKNTNENFKDLCHKAKDLTEINDYVERLLEKYKKSGQQNN